MKRSRTRTIVAAAGAAFAMTLTACGDDSEGVTDVPVEENPEFPEGSTMAELSEAGEIKIGVKNDQPGLGFLEPGADAPTGFDVEMGRIIAGALGIEDDGIEWVETISDNRETFIQNEKVDLVIASYSITDERRQEVGQAGPYYVTGQQLLVREEDKESITTPEDTEGKKVCSVTGSTSLDRMVDEYGSEPVPFDTYSECVDQLVDGSVDAVTTDGAILLGYAADDPDELEVVGEPFSEERYGIGYQKDDAEMCEFLNETIEASFEDGTWAEAFEGTLGESGVETPEQPELDPCP
jgi:glutamate transport system substrate-binding protein